MRLSVSPLTLTTLPSDVLCHIALSTLPSTPIPEDLQSIFALLSTCRSINELLSIEHNYELYGDIFRLMFDVALIKQRLGPQVVKSSVLASELRHRCLLLKRIKSKFQALKLKPADSELLFIDLTHIFLMMTEDDGKNRSQLLHLASQYHSQSLAVGRASKHTLHQSKAPMFAYLVAVVLMNQSEDDVREETARIRERVLDLLEPFTLLDLSSTAIHQAEDLTYAIRWYGVSCLFTPPTLTYLARLSTISRYNAIKWTQDPSSVLNQRSPSQLPILWNDHVRVVPCVDEDGVPPVPIGSVQGSWEGFLVISSPTDPPSKTFICTQPMQFKIREFVSVTEEGSLPYFNLGDTCLTREVLHPWFPQGVTFKETPTTLYIQSSDGRCLEYQSASNPDLNGNSTVFDTVLIGETEPSHANRHGDYVFKGRVNHREGTVAIVRTPTNSTLTELGRWVFYGQLKDKGSFMGDWWSACSTPFVPAVRGWFNLSKKREG